MKIKILSGIICSLAVMTVFGCGGGGGDGAVATTVSGVASKGPIINGQVQVFAVNEATGGEGTLLSTVTTDDSGAYTAPLSTFTGPILVKVTGSYKDEATGATVTVDQAAPLRAAISNATGNTSVMVTPLTELAVRKVAGGVLSRTNIDKANADITAVFNLDSIITTKPADATNAASASAPAAEKDYGLVLATISQMMKNSGKSLGQILADMSTNITGTTMSVNTTLGFKAALFEFLSNTGINRTGITPEAVSAINPSTMKVAILKISTVGGTVGGIDFTVTLPAGVTVAADVTTKQTVDGAVVVSGAATTTGASMSVATFDAATAKLRVLLVNASTIGFPAGQFVTVACIISASSTVTPAQLQSAVSAAVPAATNNTGAAVTGITLTATPTIF